MNAETSAWFNLQAVCVAMQGTPGHPLRECPGVPYRIPAGEIGIEPCRKKRSLREAIVTAVTDRKVTYLLPCSCGRGIAVEPRQAGETVRCECGQALTVPTMREVQNLRPGPIADAMPAAREGAWGKPQRFIATGLVVVLLAAIAAAILYNQFPTHFAGMRSPEAERQFVKRLSTRQTKEYFHRWILPGINVYEQSEVQGKRSEVYIGMGILAGVGAIGLILVGIGIAGIARRRTRAP